VCVSVTLYRCLLHICYHLPRDPGYGSPRNPEVRTRGWICGMPRVYLRKLAHSIEKLFCYRQHSYSSDQSTIAMPTLAAIMKHRIEIRYVVRLKRKFHSLSKSANSDTFGRKTSKILNRSLLTES